MAAWLMAAFAPCTIGPGKQADTVGALLLTSASEMLLQLHPAQATQPCAPTQPHEQKVGDGDVKQLV